MDLESLFQQAYFDFPFKYIKSNSPCIINKDQQHYANGFFSIFDGCKNQAFQWLRLLHSVTLLSPFSSQNFYN